MRGNPIFTDCYEAMALAEEVHKKFPRMSSFKWAYVMPLRNIGCTWTWTSGETLDSVKLGEQGTGWTDQVALGEGESITGVAVVFPASKDSIWTFAADIRGPGGNFIKSIGAFFLLL